MGQTLINAWKRQASEGMAGVFAGKAEATSAERESELGNETGIGPLAATALLAATGDGGQFRRGAISRPGSASVPREYSTGGKTTLLGISKRGHRYVRRLLIHGPRSCVTHLDRRRNRRGGWLDALQARMHVNKVPVALAAKVARTAWASMPFTEAPLAGKDGPAR